ncbi:MAG: patatin-like phospholipase family protein [Candidatus Thiodiazotropha sp. (ex Codakia orbicularis)]|nr:patatin-like phospholipase family protein [Candidatus Thiodiazotropha sp. (ex Codakia orbicularis)]
MNKQGIVEKCENTPATFEQVLDEELAHFGIRAPRKPYTGRSDSDENLNCDTSYSSQIISDAHDARLCGLAFSGGGIRSATFNLGVLQGLSKLKLLNQFDYLSTVSGGGYIGNWFSAWVRREDKKSDMAQKSEITLSVDGESHSQGDKTACGINIVSDHLAAAAGTGKAEKSRGAQQPDPGPIQHLREYSNYLTPRRGLWSKDAWTFAIGYLRNLFLTLTVLMGAAITLVLLGHVYISLLNRLLSIVTPNHESIFTVTYGLFLLSVGMAALSMGAELSPGRTQKARNCGLAYSSVALTLISAMVGSLWLYPIEPNKFFSNTIFVAGMGLMLTTIVLGLLGRWLGNHGSFGGTKQSNKWSTDCDRSPIQEEKALQNMVWRIFGAIAGILVLVVSWYPLILFKGEITIGQSALEYIVVSVPFVVLSYSLSAVVSVGFSGSAMQEVEREWLGRFFGALMKLTIVYSLFIAVLIYLHPDKLNSNENGPQIYEEVAAALWAIMSFLGVYLATREPRKKSDWVAAIKKIGINVASGVFIIGLILLTNWLVLEVMKSGISHVFADNTQGWMHDISRELNEPGAEASSLLLVCDYWLIAAISSLVFLFFTLAWSRRVGVNEFSLHSLYGNRLVRAYLGATNLDRNAHPFTGFDQQDNALRMVDLAHNSGRGPGRAPYLIVNAAVNMVSGERLAWQKRKAASFTFTPLFSGYEFCDMNGADQSSGGKRIGGYAYSGIYGTDHCGVSLGKAMAISGAAASPSMGYYSTPALSFLMTMLNVRLGWWLPNTTKSKTSFLQRRGPFWGLLYLVYEALGQSSIDKSYIYLSDGGHFENLGLYELVRRRCRFIIVSDVGADPEYEFKDLGNAIEKCRTDLGVPIDIDISQIKPVVSTGHSRLHCAVGYIGYRYADPGQHDGTLLYIKASLTGDEPMDVTAYAGAHKSFPHQSTMDQWFDETQFESYRVLGELSLVNALNSAVDIAKHRKLSKEHFMERIFLELRKQWYAPAMKKTFNNEDIDSQLDRLIEMLRSDDRLAFLDSQLYPNLERVVECFKMESNKEGSASMPANAAKARLAKNVPELRAGFYYCKQLIQFMQQVFHQLKLDTEYALPSNRGWMNLFRRWAFSSMFHFTWAVTAGTYSPRFQSFCEYHLNLNSGEPELRDEVKLGARVKGDVKQPNVTIGLMSKAGRVIASRGNKLEETLNKAGINEYEYHLIVEFITAYVYMEVIQEINEPIRFDIYPLSIEIDNVSDTIKAEKIPLNAGFVIIGPHPDHKHIKNEKAVVYFRIRSSMRNMDLARKSFKAIDKKLTKEEGSELKPFQRICSDRELPMIEYVANEKDSAQRRRAFKEIHSRDTDQLERCHWFSQLLVDVPSGKECKKHQLGG